MTNKYQEEAALLVGDLAGTKWGKSVGLIPARQLSGVNSPDLELRHLLAAGTPKRRPDKLTNKHHRGGCDE